MSRFQREIATLTNWTLKPCPTERSGRHPIKSSAGTGFAGL